MKYKNVTNGIFINRPNRFIANVLLGGESTVCHVKNTGRCKELLLPGATVYVEKSGNTGRKTEYDLIAVKKGERLINMDANAPNAVFGEWLKAGGLGFVPDLVKAEYTHGDSRFDFYFETGEQKALAEIKGVTLEDNGVVRFPDAPTQRGVKHLNGLIAAAKQGYAAYAVFVVQLSNVLYFEPNRATHPEFAQTLARAKAAGVNIMALECAVTPDSLEIAGNVEVNL